MEALTLLLNLPPLPDISGCVAFALHVRNPLVGGPTPLCAGEVVTYFRIEWEGRGEVFHRPLSHSLQPIISLF